MGPIGKDKLVFDTTATLSDNDNIGAYLRASDGTLITHTTDGSAERLDVSAGAEKLDGSAYSAGDRGNYILAVDNAGNYAPLRVNASGELLADVSITSGADKAEDSASASGDIGSYVLSVRQDVLAGSTSADGDYQSFKTDAIGSLWAHISASAAPDAPNSAFKPSAVSVTTSATPLPASPVAARKRMLIQNLSNKQIFIGDATVTAVNGTRIAAGGNWEVEVGPGISVNALVTAGTADVRLIEIA